MGFKHNGKPLVYFGYAKAHCALYGIDTHGAELKAYDLSKGTIRFPADKPLPDRLVAKIVKARIANSKRPAKRWRRPSSSAWQERNLARWPHRHDPGGRMAVGRSAL